MAIQFGTVDGLLNISDESILLFVNAIDAFNRMGGQSYAENAGVAYGTAFQRFVDPVYLDNTKSFNLKNIETPVLTRNGNEQSPARVTFCKKMGLLKIDEDNHIFELTQLGKAIIDKEINVKEYAFILLSKMGIFKDNTYVENVFGFLSSFFKDNAIISENSIKSYVSSRYNDTDIIKTRFDIILNALDYSGFTYKINSDNHILSSTGYAFLMREYANRSAGISKAILDTDDIYCDYIGALDFGVFDILDKKNYQLFDEYFPNLKKYMHMQRSYENSKMKKQIIYYGAPGTGKSNTIKCEVDQKGFHCIRTTFHPDSDYSTFVGAYKPTSVEEPVMTVIGTKAVPVENPDGTHRIEKRINYEFVPQAFLKAYTSSWKNPDVPFFLIIEEINRGNCAQIFGDLFQLLDRSENGESEYSIVPDEDIQKFLLTDKKYGFASIDEDLKKIIPKEVYLGELMILPSNLYIWATMNTSDQSLFPIDSAFKRRWDWKYVPIADAHENWIINVNGNQYDWWDFLEKINDEIWTATNSEDKKLGYYFCKTENGIINAETFVGKVIFYLWNDVFKDYGFDNPIFDDPDGTEVNPKLTFDKFYKADGINKVEHFLSNLGVKLVGNNEEEIPEEETNDTSFKLNGQSMSLRDIAMNVVINYSKNNPNKSAQDIRDYFMNLCKGIGVAHIVETESEYHQRDGQASQKRSASEVILTGERGKIYVSTQWRSNGNFKGFMDVVNKNDLGIIS
jgi:hypothetical protein